jgi:beta-glucanase (GH16 family)
VCDAARLSVAIALCSSGRTAKVPDQGPRLVRATIAAVPLEVHRRTLLISAAAALVSLPGVLASGSRVRGSMAAAAHRADQHVVFVDDFAGPSLDRTKWNVEVPPRGVNNEQQAYVDAQDTVSIATGGDADGASNGALLIRAQWRAGVMGGTSFDFVSGRLNTRGKFEFAYGTAAARMKLSAGSGLWPAFWALGNGEWPATGEIDVMENVGEREWTSAALHGPGYSGNTPLVSRFHFPAGQDATGWHVYAVDWTSDRIVFKVDDAVAYQVRRATVERYGRWAYDNPKYLIVNLALGGEYPAAVNSVKSPYPGLPASTVELIKAGRARVLVDWVRVTQERR